MAFRIANVQCDQTPKAKSQKKPDYLDFIRRLPCVITGRRGVEAAHLSFSSPKFGHYGRAHGTKASDRWALPLCSEEHALQHSMNEEEFWLSHVNRTHPHILALTLWGLWSELGDDAEPFAVAIIMQGVMGR